MISSLDANLLASGKKSAAPPVVKAPPSRSRRILKLVAYFAIFFAALFFFFYLKTPSSLVQGLVLNNLNAGGVAQWQADRISSNLFLLPHLRAENLSMTPMRPGLPTLTFETLRIFPSFFSLIPWTGKMNPAASFDGRAYKAEFSGKVWPLGSALNLEINNMDFTELTPLLEAGVQLKGVISSLVTEVSLPGGRLAAGNGSLQVQGKNFVVDPAALKLPLPLPILDLGALELRGRITQGKLVFEKFVVGSAGKDLEIQATGSIQLSDNLPYSVMDLRLRLKPSAKILGAMPSLKTMLETIAAPVANGFYATKIAGTFAQPGIPQPDK